MTPGRRARDPRRSQPGPGEPRPSPGRWTTALAGVTNLTRAGPARPMGGDARPPAQGVAGAPGTLPPTEPGDVCGDAGTCPSAPGGPAARFRRPPAGNRKLRGGPRDSPAKVPAGAPAPGKGPRGAGGGGEEGERVRRAGPPKSAGGGEGADPFGRAARGGSDPPRPPPLLSTPRSPLPFETSGPLPLFPLKGTLRVSALPRCRSPSPLDGRGPYPCHTPAGPRGPPSGSGSRGTTLGHTGPKTNQTGFRPPSPGPDPPLTPDPEDWDKNKEDGRVPSGP